MQPYENPNFSNPLEEIIAQETYSEEIPTVNGLRMFLGTWSLIYRDKEHTKLVAQMVIKMNRLLWTIQNQAEAIQKGSSDLALRQNYNYLEKKYRSGWKAFYQALDQQSKAWWNATKQHLMLEFELQKKVEELQKEAEQLQKEAEQLQKEAEQHQKAAEESLREQQKSFEELKRSSTILDKQLSKYSEAMIYLLQKHPEDFQAVTEIMERKL